MTYRRLLATISKLKRIKVKVNEVTLCCMTFKHNKLVSGALFDDLPPENVTPVGGGGGEVSGRKRRSCDSLDEDTPATKVNKIWGLLL